jgi:hypothetical protein
LPIISQTPGSTSRLGADVRLLFAALLTVSVAFAVVQGINYATQQSTLYLDFVGLWSFARFAAENPPERLYDTAALVAFEVRFFGEPGISYPVPYPPPFLLLVWPIGLMPYALARVVWIAVTLAAYLAAICAPDWRKSMIAASALAPTVIVSSIYGQSGLISAALMIGGARLVNDRPVIAGVLFAALIYKPQLGILIPVALIAGRYWRSLISAVATVCVIVALTVVAFGWSTWSAWANYVPVFSAMAAANSEHLSRLMPTITSAVLSLGGGATTAAVTQVLAFTMAAASVWISWRRGSGVAQTALLSAATFVATPYGFVYDMPMVTAAALLFLWDRTRAAESLGAASMVVLLYALLLPIVLLSAPASIAVAGVTSNLLLLWFFFHRTAMQSCSPAAVPG